MTLGERIAYYRGKLGLSQGDLAERLGVSRQAVSKWETDAGLPDLERLVALSRLYGITIDALVTGEEQEKPKEEAAEAIPSAEAPPAKPAAGGQKTVGYILLGCGILCAALALVLSPVLLVPAAYLLLCAVLCLTLRRYAGRVIAGGTLLAVWLLWPRWTGLIHPGAILNPNWYQHGELTTELLIAWGLWAILFLYVILALRHTAWQKFTPLALGWTAVLGLHGWLAPFWRILGGASAAGVSYYLITSLAVNLLAVAVVLLTVRELLRAKRRKKA